jgi:hypothetical protein
VIAPILRPHVPPAKSERERRVRNVAVAEPVRRGAPFDPAQLAATVAELLDTTDRGGTIRPAARSRGPAATVPVRNIAALLAGVL